MALAFSGSNYCLAGSVFGTIGDNVTISWWARTTTTGNTAMFGVIEDGDNEMIAVEMNYTATDRLAMIWRNTGSQTDTGYWEDASWRDGAWHHHIVTRSGATIRYYFDGAEQTLTFDSNNLATGDLTFTTRQIAFGARNNQGTIDLNSVVDLASWSIYDATLADSQILMLSKGLAFLPTQSIRNCYPLASDVTQIDIVGSNTASPTSSPTLTDPPQLTFFAHIPFVGQAAPVVFTYVASDGGLILGGQSTESTTYNYIPTGGLVLGGDAFEFAPILYAASGGLVIGGTAPMASSAWVFTGSGGLNAIFFSDDFNRADNDDLGSDWTEVVGDWDISSNELITSSDLALTVTSITQTNANYYVQADISMSAAGDKVALIARYVNATTYYAFLVSTNNELSLVKEDSGATILNTESLSISTSTDYVIKFSLFDDMLKGEVFNSSGTLLGSVSAIDSAISSVGSAGMYYEPIQVPPEGGVGELPMLLPESIGTG